MPERHARRFFLEMEQIEALSEGSMVVRVEHCRDSVKEPDRTERR